MALKSNYKSNQIVVFDERGKPEYPEKNLSEHSREPSPGIDVSNDTPLVTTNLLEQLRCASLPTASEAKQ